MVFSELKHCRVITELDERLKDPKFIHETPEQLDGYREQIMWVDGENIPGAFYSEYIWHYPGKPQSQAEWEKVATGPHTHPFGKVIAFAGSNPDNLYDLGGEVEIWIENQKFVQNRSFLAYIPAGMCHGPIKVKKVDRPIFQYVLGSAPKYESTKCEMPNEDSGRDLSKLFVYSYKQGIDLPDYRKGGGPNDDPGRHDHITYLDEEVVPGADFYVEASWMGTKPRAPLPPGVKHPGPKEHIHPFPEIITFFGTNRDDLYDLCGDVVLFMEGKEFIIDRSFVAYIPENIPHAPLYVRNIHDRMFHFTAAPAKKYI